MHKISCCDVTVEMYLLYSDWIVYIHTSRVQGDNQIFSANYEWFVAFFNIFICVHPGRNSEAIADEHWRCEDNEDCHHSICT